MKKLSLDRIFKALLSLGLSQIDSRVYFHLATNGPALARNITTELSLNSRQTYRSLNNLQQIGIIIIHDSHPSEFLALPFEEVLNKLIDLKNEQAQEIKKRKKELLSSWRANGK